MRRDQIADFMPGRWCNPCAIDYEGYYYPIFVALGGGEYYFEEHKKPRTRWLPEGQFNYHVAGQWYTEDPSDPVPY